MNRNFLNDAEAEGGTTSLEEVPEKTMPLGVEGFSGEPVVLDSGSSKRSFRSGTLILLLVVALAGVGLYSMRTLSRVTAAVGGETDNENVIESFLRSLTGTGSDQNVNPLLITPDEAEQQMVTTLVDDRTLMQVPLADVQKNPFVLFARKPVAVADGAPQIDADREREAHRQACELRRQDFEKGAAKLRVIMVMGGSTPLANLSGTIVRVGDTVVDERLGVAFEVVKISPGAVTVRAYDADLDFSHEIVLRLYRDE